VQIVQAGRPIAKNNYFDGTRLPVKKTVGSGFRREFPEFGPDDATKQGKGPDYQALVPDLGNSAQ
jgi:hypothetical protein